MGAQYCLSVTNRQQIINNMEAAARKGGGRNDDVIKPNCLLGLRAGALVGLTVMSDRLTADLITM